MAYLSQQAVGEVAAVSKTRKISVGIFALILLLAIFSILWLKPRTSDRNDSSVATGNVDTKTKITSSGLGKGKRIEREEKLPPVDPFKLIDKFDAQFVKLLDAEGDVWATGLKELASIANRLGEQSDFDSVTAAALLVTRASDLAISKLMAAEVSPEDTLPGLKEFSYSIPSDKRIIAYICQLHPEGEALRRKNPTESVTDFLFGLEEDPIIPMGEWSREKTETEIISGGNASGKLLFIVAAKYKLDSAEITALYLQRGGNPRLTGIELESDMGRLAGKEIEKLPKPLFGEENPTAVNIVAFIRNAQNLYKRR